MVRKNAAFEEKGSAAAAGHNQAAADKARIEVTQFVAKKKREIALLDQAIKDKLNWAKDTHSILKGGVRKAVKLLTMTDAQLAAKDEVEAEAERIFNACRDLPLFAKAREEAEEDEEEAA